MPTPTPQAYKIPVVVESDGEVIYMANHIERGNMSFYVVDLDDHSQTSFEVRSEHMAMFTQFVAKVCQEVKKKHEREGEIIEHFESGDSPLNVIG